MTQTMKPRKFWNLTNREILIRGTWHRLGACTLIGSRNWTIRDTDGNVLDRCSGNTAYEIREI